MYMLALIVKGVIPGVVGYRFDIYMLAMVVRELFNCLWMLIKDFA